MSTATRVCPNCQASVSPDAIACPHCRTPLKALGHVGIPLHQAGTGEVLCDTCLYHQDNSCNYPQRSNAKDCIMYVDVRQPLEPLESKTGATQRNASPVLRLSSWIRHNRVLVILVAMIGISIWATLSGG